MNVLVSDEWKDWKGEVEDTDTSQIVFLLLSFGVFAVFSVFLLFAEFLVAPRIMALHTYAVLGLRILIAVAIVMMFTWIFLIALSATTGIDFLFGLDRKLYGILMLIPYVSGIAKRFKISKDRVANSFIKLHNSIIRIRKRFYKSKEVIVLLPRCLNKDVMKRIISLCSRYNLQYFVLAGGEAAREIVRKLKPKAAVAVACERDLLSGIRDTASKVVVLGIPNKRPNGPCRDTIANIIEFEKAIRFLLGMNA
ncbi:DUF116 domain-containing protein [Candidatus Woesearchaeota archaeon]|nr:DUF116 domain-containing protein [Candidatus Woesearchaeota archaeon]